MGEFVKSFVESCERLVEILVRKKVVSLGEFCEILESPLRESETSEAIHNLESKSIESKFMDCHDSAFAESKINNNNKILNKIYNFLFLRNLNERRSPKKCDKFHSLGLQGIAGKWRSPLTKGDFKGGTLPLCVK